MIIQALIDMILNVFAVLTLPISIPGTPEEIKEVLLMAIEYITMGAKIVGNYCDMPYLLSLFVTITSIDIGIYVYKVIMWILRKVPFIGMT